MDFFDGDIWVTTKNLQDHSWQKIKEIRKEFEKDFAYAYEDLKEKVQNVKIGEDILRELHLCYEWMPSYSKEANLKCLTRSYNRLEKFLPAFKEMVNYCGEFDTWLNSDKDHLIAIVEDLFWSLKEQLLAEDDGLTGCYHTSSGMCLAR